MRQQLCGILRDKSGWREAYLLVRVPHNMLDILRVRVYDGDALVLVFFVHWEAHRGKKKSFPYTGANVRVPNIWRSATLQFDTNLPRPRHSCLGYTLPADSPKEPMPHI